jgi:hypothetical protein
MNVAQAGMASFLAGSRSPEFGRLPAAEFWRIRLRATCQDFFAARAQAERQKDTLSSVGRTLQPLAILAAPIPSVGVRFPLTDDPFEMA